MSPLPPMMNALLLKEDGYSSDRRNVSELNEVEPYIELGQIDVPSLKPGQVLIKVKMAAVNPSDTIFIRGFYGQPRVKGAPAGFEGVGEVVAAKGLYGQFLKGKRVAFVASPSGLGSWAEYAVTEAAVCIPLRKDVRDEDGAAMIVNPLTAAAMVGMVPENGAFVATAAASQLGKLMAGMAAETGRRMIAVTRRDEPLDHLHELGAVAALNEKNASFDEDLKAIIAEEKPRVLLDAVGGVITARIFHEMPSDSRLINYGRLTEEPFTLKESGQLIFMRKRIEGFWLVTWMRKTPFLKKMRAIKQVQARFASGRWRTEVTARIPLSNAMTDLPSALGEPDGKVFITVS